MNRLNPQHHDAHKTNKSLKTHSEREDFKAKSKAVWFYGNHFQRPAKIFIDLSFIDYQSWPVGFTGTHEKAFGVGPSVFWPAMETQEPVKSTS